MKEGNKWWGRRIYKLKFACWEDAGRIVVFVREGPVTRRLKYLPTTRRRMLRHSGKEGTFLVFELTTREELNAISESVPDTHELEVIWLDAEPTRDKVREVTKVQHGYRKPQRHVSGWPTRRAKNKKPKRAA